MQRLAVVCVPLMALVQATTWTMYLSRRRGTIHSLERWRALAGYPKHATKIARSTPLRLVCHSFTSTIYLPILARKDGILIPYFLIRMCVRTVPQGESYNFIGTWRFVRVVASPLKFLLLFPWVTSIFLYSWNRIGTRLGGISLSFFRLISSLLILRALLGDGACYVK